jgi:dynamin 1-like protein
MDLSSLSLSPRSEAAFFSSTSAYHDVTSQCGIPNLARRLNAILVEHIRALLPSLRRKIQVNLALQ